MNCPKNIDDYYRIIEEKFYIKKGINKKNELARLLFEICKKNNISLNKILENRDIKKYIKDKEYNFKKIKNILIKLRYNENISIDNIYLPPLKFYNSRRVYKFNGSLSPEKIYVEREALNYNLTDKILKKFPEKEIIIIDKVKELKRNWKEYIETIGKNELFLVKESFDVFKPCPCSKNMVSCGYFIFNLGFGCPFDCSYCYLQHYTNFPGIIFQVNIEEILNKLDIILNKVKSKVLRIGTGEFTDSLAYDDISEYSKYIVPFFAEREHILELKTKSTKIGNLLDLNHNNRTVVSWSLNTPYIIEKEELFTPSLEERLKAAKEVIKAGYKVGFHYDPIVFYENWEKDYKETIDKMFDYAKDNILWISLGTLRFHRDLKVIIERRFPNNVILDGDLFIDNYDKKMRYSSKLREYMLKRIYNYIKSKDKKVVVYICMENYSLWNKISPSFLESKEGEHLGIHYFIHS